MMMDDIETTETSDVEEMLEQDKRDRKERIYYERTGEPFELKED